MNLHTALIAALFSTILAAAPAPIGVVTASGHFHLEGSRIWGNSTLFEGARVETGDASSELALSSGVKVQLGAASMARVWKGRLELERGTGQVTAKSAFQVSASGMTVEGSRFRLTLGSDARLLVAALAGDARVSLRGAVLAKVPAGRSMSFAMQQPVTRNGCLLWKNTGFLLQVDDSPEVLQLTGDGLAAQVGNRIQMTGLPSATQPTITPAASVVNVTSVTRTATGGCLSSAAALTAQTQMPTAPSAVPAKPGVTAPTTAASGGGMSTGAKVGIIAAIGGGGAGAALALGGKKDSTSR